MPTDDDQEELDDGSAGGAIRWSPDNAIKPPAASAAQSGAPMSWDTLFSAPQPGTATGQQQAVGTGANMPAAVPSQGDKLFASGPSHQPTVKAESNNNPFTTPDSEPAPSTAPVFRPETMPRPETSAGPAPAQAAFQPRQEQPQQAQQPAQQQARPPQPLQSQSFQSAAPPPAPSQGTPQALGFNPAPGFSSSANLSAIGGTGGQSNPGSPAPKVYFTAEDIEEEIMIEQGIATQEEKPIQPGFGARPQPAPPSDPSPYAQNPASQGSAYGAGSQGGSAPNPQNPGVPSQYSQSPAPYGQAPAPYAQPVGSQSSARAPAVVSTPHKEEGTGEDGPDLSSVPEIETARIWEQRTSREVLLGILKAKRAEYAVALFASTDGAVQGEMLVVKSVVIHGAKLVEPDLSGYEAIKVMLSIPHGTYTLLDVTEYVESAQQLEQGLNIRLTPLANALPNLPDSVEELMGASQISRIRSKGPADLEAAAVKEKPPRHQTSLRERLPSTKMIVLILFTILALIMMVIVLYLHR